MQEGILRIGDTVKYSVQARHCLPTCSDNLEHVVERIDKNAGGQEIAFLKDCKTPTATSWLKLVRKWKKHKK